MGLLSRDHNGRLNEQVQIVRSNTVNSEVQERLPLWNSEIHLVAPCQQAGHCRPQFADPSKLSRCRG
ncbi:hypothetical protein GQ600_7753 [Phytophthora cactorum]|nr:hypothetical protein GQ600_7753 [Phytophthora cactorum]